ncbi:MAG: hypothetical protein ACKOWC_03920 [Limnohabitans sp.]
MSYRIKALLARLLPRWFKPPLTDEQIRAIYKRARTEAFIRQFTTPQEHKP